LYLTEDTEKITQCMGKYTESNAKRCTHQCHMKLLKIYFK
jgi:hypothetical protein